MRLRCVETQPVYLCGGALHLAFATMARKNKRQRKLEENRVRRATAAAIVADTEAIDDAPAVVEYLRFIENCTPFKPSCHTP